MHGVQSSYDLVLQPLFYEVKLIADGKNFSSRMHFIETNLVDSDRSENPGMMVDRNDGSQKWKPLGSNHPRFSTISGTATSTHLLKEQYMPWRVLGN